MFASIQFFFTGKQNCRTCVAYTQWSLIRAVEPLVMSIR